MITRIVKMTFHPELVNEFVELFSSAKPHIESCRGCMKVELHRDSESPNVYFTLSYWESVETLDVYRQSELFHNTWGRAKQYFVDRPEAWSIERLF